MIVRFIRIQIADATNAQLKSAVFEGGLAVRFRHSSVVQRLDLFAAVSSTSLSACCLTTTENDFRTRNLTRLVLCCIEAKFRKKICVGKLSPRSTQCTPLHRSLISIFSLKFVEFFYRKCDFGAVQRSALCRSRRELSNAYFLQNLTSIQPITSV